MAKFEASDVLRVVSMAAAKGERIYDFDGGVTADLYEWDATPGEGPREGVIILRSGRRGRQFRVTVEPVEG